MVRSGRAPLLAALTILVTAAATATCGGQSDPGIALVGDSGEGDGGGAKPADAATRDASLDATTLDAQLDAGGDGEGALDATTTDAGTGAETSNDSAASEASGESEGGTATEAGSGDDSGTTNEGDAQAEAAVDAGAEASSDAGADADASPVTCPPAVHSGSSAVAYQIDPQHTGAQPGDVLTLPLCQRWSHDFGATLATPVVENGLVFVVATPINGQAAVYALDENTGAVVWGPRNLGGSGEAAPGGVALDGGQLFAVSGDGVLASFDPASGTMLWQTTLTGESFWYSSPVAVGGVVVVSGAESTVYGVRESDGALLWTYDAAEDSSSPAMTTDALFLHDNCGAVYRIDKDTGVSVWTHPGTCGAGGFHSIAILDGELYVTDVEDPAQGGVVVDPSTGAQVGTFDAFSTPAGSGGIGYFIPYLSRALTAIPLGTTTAIWSSSVQVGTSPLVVGSNVVAGLNGALSVFSTFDGSLVSSVFVPVLTGSDGTPGLQEADGLLFVVENTALVAY